MIITEAELRAALGLTPTISAAQTARLMLAMAACHASVKKYLGYEPEQRTWANQLYPRAEGNGAGDGDGMWDRNSAGTHAVWESGSRACQYLQLEHLPVREVTAVNVDPSARFGQGSADFGGGTAWLPGVSYYLEWEEEHICRTGQLIATGAWPATPGTVQVSYRAGYSPSELAGQATVTNTNDGGFITVKGVDAAGIKQAAILEGMRAYHTFKSMSVNSLTGIHVPGALQSEHLGSYSYSLASGQAAALLSGMQVAISPEAAMLLEGFVHMGVMLL